jgi:hypothetical protein
MIMSNKHTPGPWEVSCSVQVVGASPGNRCIVSQPFTDGTQGPVIGLEAQIANANLIAAAPDLLEALENILDNEKQSSFEHWASATRPSGDCESVHSQWLESSSYQDFLDLYGDEIAAVSKARGQS